VPGAVLELTSLCRSSCRTKLRIWTSNRKKRSSEGNGIEFLSFPIVDRSVPAPGAAVRDFLSELTSKLSSGKNIVIHCRQGIRRAGLVAASLLIERGFSPEPADSSALNPSAAN
jgi:protein-tyrosine phosphatase